MAPPQERYGVETALGGGLRNLDLQGVRVGTCLAPGQGYGWWGGGGVQQSERKQGLGQLSCGVGGDSQPHSKPKLCKNEERLCQKFQQRRHTCKVQLWELLRLSIYDVEGIF